MNVFWHRLHIHRGIIVSLRFTWSWTLVGPSWGSRCPQQKKEKGMIHFHWKLMNENNTFLCIYTYTHFNLVSVSFITAPNIIIIIYMQRAPHIMKQTVWTVSDTHICGKHLSTPTHAHEDKFVWPTPSERTHRSVNNLNGCNVSFAPLGDTPLLWYVTLLTHAGH